MTKTTLLDDTIPVRHESTLIIMIIAKMHNQNKQTPDGLFFARSWCEKHTHRSLSKTELRIACRASSDRRLAPNILYQTSRHNTACNNQTSRNNAITKTSRHNRHAINQTSRNNATTKRHATISTTTEVGLIKDRDMVSHYTTFSP